MRVECDAHVCKILDTPAAGVVEALREITAYEPKETNNFIKIRAMRKRGIFIPPGGHRKYLYHKSARTFPAGLLPVIREKLPELVWPQDVETPEAKPWQVHQKTPRAYQVEAWQALTQAKRAIAKLPTGTGKSLLCGMLASSYPDSKVLVTVPNKRLLHQSRESLQESLQESIGMLGDSEQDLNARVVVATIQSLVSHIKANNFATLTFLNAVGVWICDECHGAAADSYRDLSRVLNQTHLRYGVTATWMREDGTQLVMESVLSPLVAYEYTYETAFRDRVLTPIQVVFRPFAHQLPPKKSKPPYAKLYTEQVVENTLRNLGICLDAAACLDAGIAPAIVLVSRIAHGKKLASYLGCHFVNGEQESKAVDAQLEAIASGQAPLTVASGILNVGVDLPNLAAAINAAGGDSKIAALQKPGRGLRLHKNKARFYYIDYFDDEPNYLKEHSNSRRFLYKLVFPKRVFDVRLESIQSLDMENTHEKQPQRTADESNR